MNISVQVYIHSNLMSNAKDEDLQRIFRLLTKFYKACNTYE